MSGFRRRYDRSPKVYPFFDADHVAMVLYESEGRGDPSTPIEDYFAPPYGHDPDTTDRAARLDLMNYVCRRYGRYPQALPFLSESEAWEWLDFRSRYPLYFAKGGDYLMVGCPQCRAKPGQMCLKMVPVVGTGTYVPADPDAPELAWPNGEPYKTAPHYERELWFTGQHNRGLLNPVPF